MNNNFSIEIIEQQIDSETVKTISARELHQKLEVKSRFNDWINNRIKKYGFIENEDFVWVTKNLITYRYNGQKGISQQKECLISIQMAIIIIQKVTDNPFSAKIYKQLLSLEKREVYIKEPLRKEIEFFLALKTVLKPMNIELETQFNVLGYRIDGYIKDFNLAIEYDESHHNSKTNKINDSIRV